MEQYQVYSVSTNDFNTVAEKELFDAMIHYRKWKRVLSAIPVKDARHAALTSRLNVRIATAKEEYLALIKENRLIRELNENALNEYHLVSLFESSLSRMCGFQPNNITTDLIIVETFFYDITKQNVLNGFFLRGEKYRYLYSSAAEIRTKKTVFIKESLYAKIEKTLMCGLTINKINTLGGINPNKMIAYTALSSSATEVWDVDLDRCIVIDDVETEVEGEVDFIDDTDYTVTRQVRNNLIAQNDGAGMILPKVSKKAFMFRLPWMKGALCPFNFVKYIEENNMSPRISDIYGVEHDIIEENIHVIFTKSQFKLWKFYKDFDEYKAKFKKYHCIAGLCNEEPDRIPTSAINYQMLQTLIDITDDEVDALIKQSNNTLRTIGSSKETMLRVFGADAPDTPYQEALLIYPELLTDAYSKEKLKEIKKALVKRFKAGKLEIFGKYTFVFPDFTFLMDRWFGCVKQPKGLLANGEVFCNLFPEGDLLLERAPHLYIEHCPRWNKVTDETKKWFGVSASVFVSPHDLITRIHQSDFDGDRLLVTDNRVLIDAAKRTIEKYDVVPLYYVAKKAEPKKITPKTLYAGLEAGFKHSNIGIYSNNITKIWNLVDWRSASKEDALYYLKLVKLLCAENNFVIDAAKTLYLPTRPEEIDKEIKAAIKGKVPHFFKYAKKKTNEQVAEKTDSLVNRLDDKIVNPRISFTAAGLGKLNYHYLMNNAQIGADKEVVEMYKTICRQYHFRLNVKDGLPANITPVARNILKEFEDAFPAYSLNDICDMLVKHLYHERKNVGNKELLWDLFGGMILDNLLHKVPHGSKMCKACGRRYVPRSHAHKFCIRCARLRKLAYDRELQAQRRKIAKQMLSESFDSTTFAGIG